MDSEAAASIRESSVREAPSLFTASGISSWARSLRSPQPSVSGQEESQTGTAGKSTFARFTGGLGLRLSPKDPVSDENAEGTSTAAQPGVFGSITQGLVDSSRSAVKAVQVKARHIVSQNKRRYQEGGFDLDMTYITENIIAMGFPAGDMSSGFFGYVEGFYRNHMEEVIKFFETHHKGRYKVYNLCSERLYDASLFEGKVACFPFDDHNCPPIQLIISFCQSAYSWLKEDIENVVVVHCKAGMARTGLMISSLLLYLKFFPTAEESIDYYNQKRCLDGKGLVLPSQIRYVKYFERILTYSNGENQPGRRCMLRGFRLHRCPYWIRPSITISDHNGVLFSTKKHPRTKDLSPEDFWFSAPSDGGAATPDKSKGSGSQDKDDVFSDSDGEDNESSKNREARALSGGTETATTAARGPQTGTTPEQIASVTRGTEQLSLRSEGPKQAPAANEVKTDGGSGTGLGLDISKDSTTNDFKAIAADASVFTFGDDEDYESE
uniref:Phosphatidylinositol 3,4,5-trisphosphate 3-phosphatase and protein-tyrosine-phosphatase PTEN2A-like n=1 Tax=Nelumbo nucifera TaxID=4432 RepID=A0A822YDE6_NELNU|nr:TPA_asm: hypothetical protein HUJ06_028976 [Nelumbo nucifera]